MSTNVDEVALKWNQFKCSKSKSAVTPLSSFKLVEFCKNKPFCARALEDVNGADANFIEKTKSTRKKF